MNESLQLAKLFKFSCSNMDYNVIGLFPIDVKNEDILDFMSQNDEKIKEILNSKLIDLNKDVKIVTEKVSASPYCLTNLDQLPQEFFESIVFH